VHPYRLPARPYCVASDDQARALGRQELAAAFASLGDTVYFVWHNGLVKIGHSVNLRRRLPTLAARPTDLLLVLPGGQEVEQDMHDRFAHLRATGEGLGVEHFHPGEDLLAFVNERRTAMGLTAVVV